MKHTSPTLTPELQKQLEQLHDIHLPDPISWWPLAIGWWLLFALVVLILGVGIIKYSRQKVCRLTLLELNALATDNEVLLSQQLSALLKRVAIYQCRNIESLSGCEWVDYLKQNGFQKEQAEFIAFASYSEPGSYTTPNWTALKKNSKQWIKNQFKQKPGLLS